MPTIERLRLVCNPLADAPWIGSNLKMALGREETLRLVQHVAGLDEGVMRALVISMPFLGESVAAAEGSGLRIGVQGCSTHDRGAYTGEVAAQDVASMGADFVMVGHAERVALGESLESFAEQVQRAREANLNVLVCVGEEAQGDHDSDDLITQTQLIADGQFHDGDVLAYEPYWAIGEAGREAPVDYIDARMARVRSALGEDVTLVYGGSVNEGNCAQIASLDAASGVFVGRAAWSPAKWSGIEARVRGEDQ